MPPCLPRNVSRRVPRQAARGGRRRVLLSPVLSVEFSASAAVFTHAMINHRIINKVTGADVRVRVARRVVRVEVEQPVVGVRVVVAAHVKHVHAGVGVHAAKSHKPAQSVGNPLYLCCYITAIIPFIVRPRSWGLRPPVPLRADKGDGSRRSRTRCSPSSSR